MFHKWSISVLLLISICTVGAIGYFAVSAMDHTNMNSCFLPMSGSDCPMAIGALDMIEHHIAGIQAVFEGTTPTFASFLMLMLLIAAPLLWLYSKIFLPNLFATQLPNFWLLWHRKVPKHAPQPKLLKWLMLHHKRDPYASSRVYDSVSRYLRIAESTFA